MYIPAHTNVLILSVIAGIYRGCFRGVLRKFQRIENVVTQGPSRRLTMRRVSTSCLSLRDGICFQERKCRTCLLGRWETTESNLPYGISLLRFLLLYFLFIGIALSTTDRGVIRYFPIPKLAGRIRKVALYVKSQGWKMCRNKSDFTQPLNTIQVKRKK